MAAKNFMLTDLVLVEIIKKVLIKVVVSLLKEVGIVNESWFSKE